MTSAIADDTDYLLSTPANADHLRLSIEQLRRGEVEEYELVSDQDVW